MASEGSRIATAEIFQGIIYGDDGQIRYRGCSSISLDKLLTNNADDIVYFEMDKLVPVYFIHTTGK